MVLQPIFYMVSQRQAHENGSENAEYNWFGDCIDGERACRMRGRRFACAQWQFRGGCAVAKPVAFAKSNAEPVSITVADNRHSIHASGANA